MKTTMKCSDFVMFSLKTLQIARALRFARVLLKLFACTHKYIVACIDFLCSSFSLFPCTQAASASVRSLNIFYQISPLHLNFCVITPLKFPNQLNARCIVEQSNDPCLVAGAFSLPGRDRPKNINWDLGTLRKVSISIWRNLSLIKGVF